MFWFVNSKANSLEGELQWFKVWSSWTRRFRFQTMPSNPIIPGWQIFFRSNSFIIVLNMAASRRLTIRGIQCQTQNKSILCFEIICLRSEMFKANINAVAWITFTVRNNVKWNLNTCVSSRIVYWNNIICPLHARRSRTYMSYVNMRIIVVWTSYSCSEIIWSSLSLTIQILDCEEAS